MSLASRRAEAVLLPVLTGALLLILWAVAVRLSGTKVFPTPAAVWRGVVELKHRGVLGAYVRDSMLRVTAGYVVAVVTAIPLGLAIGLSPRVSAFCNAFLQLMRPISPLAWIPMSIVLFGIGSEAAIFLIFLASFFPIALSASSAISSVPAIYLRAGQNFGLSPVRLLWRVVLPAALPEILVGLRVALGVAWLVVVAAEMIAIDSGLGYLIIDARNAGKRYDLVVAGILIIGTIGLLLDVAMRRLEKLRSVRWGFSEARG